MNITLLKSIKQEGKSTMADALAAAFGPQNSVSILSVDTGNDSFNEIKADILVLVNSIGWYLSNRKLISGRPWVVSISTCFDDVLASANFGMLMDTGIKCLFSNCEPFIKQASSILPAFFTFRPTFDIEHNPDARAVGTVLSNIADRDFSLFNRVVSLLSVLGNDIPIRIYVPPDEKNRLPDNLEKYRTIIENETECYSNIRYYIQAPRITDYRSGVLPPDIVQAAIAGCEPILIRHYVLDKVLGDTISPLFTSLTDLDFSVIKMCNLENIVTVKPEIKALSTSINDLAARILEANQNWKP